MKVILLENIKRIGSIGEIIDVKRGFARNFLIANKKALHASKENIKEVEKVKSDLSKRDDKMEKGMKHGGKRRRGNKSKKHYKKGAMSKTRKGRKNFVTHKGDNDFHRRGRRQTKRQGKKSKSLLSRIFGL